MKSLLVWARAIVFVGIGWMSYHVIANSFNRIGVGIAVATVTVGVILWLIADARDRIRLADELHEIAQGNAPIVRDL